MHFASAVCASDEAKQMPRYASNACVQCMYLCRADLFASDSQRGPGYTRSNKTFELVAAAARIHVHNLYLFAAESNVVVAYAAYDTSGVHVFLCVETHSADLRT